jgi:hypothetical protein
LTQREGYLLVAYIFSFTQWPLVNWVQAEQNENLPELLGHQVRPFGVEMFVHAALCYVTGMHELVHTGHIAQGSVSE